MKNKENKAFKESFKKVETVKKHFRAFAVVREYLFSTVYDQKQVKK